VEHLKLTEVNRWIILTLLEKLNLFYIIYNLIRHKNIHEGVRPFNCKFCQKIFSSSSNLKQHMNTHTNLVKRQKFPCFICKCDKSYLYICTLKKHILNSHLEEYDKLNAEYPDRTFNEVFKDVRTNRKLDFVNFNVFDDIEEESNNHKEINENNFDEFNRTNLNFLSGLEFPDKEENQKFEAAQIQANFLNLSQNNQNNA